MDEKSLKVNYREILVLTDRIRSPEKTAIALKLAKAFLVLINENPNPEKTYPLLITEQEAWLIAFFVSPYDMDADGKALGIKLLRKVFSILLDFNAIISPDKWTKIKRIMRKKGRKKNETAIIPYDNSSHCPAKTPDKTDC